MSNFENNYSNSGENETIKILDYARAMLNTKDMLDRVGKSSVHTHTVLRDIWGQLGINKPVSDILNGLGK